jgi:hypothetical protein
MRAVMTLRALVPGCPIERRKIKEELGLRK